MTIFIQPSWSPREIKQGDNIIYLGPEKKLYGKNVIVEDISSDGLMLIKGKWVV